MFLSRQEQVASARLCRREAAISVTHLRQIMFEELTRRNYASGTICPTFAPSSTSHSTFVVPLTNSCHSRLLSCQSLMFSTGTKFAGHSNSPPSFQAASPRGTDALLSSSGLSFCAFTSRATPSIRSA